MAKGPRPWTVHLFATVFLLAGLLRLFAQLHGAAHWSELDWASLGAIDWSRERETVLAFTLMTIICIPVVAIWGFAIRAARIVVAAFSVPGLLFGWAGAMMDAKSYAVPLLFESILCLAAVLLLFTPVTKRWLTQSRDSHFSP